MIRIRRLTQIFIVFMYSFLLVGIFFGSARAYAARCAQSSFLGFPTWYKYLDSNIDTDPLTNATVCNLDIKGINDTWLIIAAVIEILLRVAALVAICFIIYGGVSYVISQGAPDKTKQAQSTAINALVGLTITVIASAAVSFIANSFN